MTNGMGIDTTITPTQEPSWLDMLKGVGTDFAGSLKKDPGMWGQIFGQGAQVFGQGDPIITGVGGIGNLLGKGKTLMSAQQARAAKEDERTKAILAAIQAGPSDPTKMGINKIQDKFNPKTGLMDTTIDLNLDGIPDSVQGGAEAGNINTNVPGNISLDQGPIAAPGTDQITRKGFDIRPFFQP